MINMHDNLTIDYEVFEEEGIKVLTVGRGDEALWQFHDDLAEALYSLLIGDLAKVDTITKLYLEDE